MPNPLNSAKLRYSDGTQIVWPESINKNFGFLQNILGWLSRMNLVLLVNSAEGKH